MGSRLDFSEIRRELDEVILPFWLERAIDDEAGGFLTCFDNSGRELTSTDKFSWAQGRFVWVLAAAADLAATGDLGIDRDLLLGLADDGARFMTDHMVRDDASCVYLTDRQGVPVGGAGESVYADCFVSMGLFRLAEATGDRDRFEIADAILRQAAEQVDTGTPHADPYPIPPGFESFGPRMIILATRLAQTRAARRVHPDEPPPTSALASARAEVLSFRLDDGTFVDHRPVSSGDADTLIARHRAPGHALEGIWMALEAAHEIGDRLHTDDLVASARIALDHGLDPVDGGIFRYVDRDGGEPRGRLVGATYESLIQRTWSTKLWWVHAEALYAAELCSHEGSDDSLAESAGRLWDYARRVFSTRRPGGEWVQIHDRHGAALNEVVALPVKDPYHVARDLMQLIQLGHRIRRETCA